MYGKLFQSCFTGSMFGAGPAVFAVWAYAISHVVKGRVELNPRMLAPTIGTDVATVEQAIQYLSSRDPNSRSPEHEGRRLVREGQFQYFVPTHAKYQALRNEDDRRAYNRQKQAESRARRRTAGVKVSNGLSLTVNDKSAMSAHADAEANAEANAVGDVGEAKAIATSPPPAVKARCAAGAAPASSDLERASLVKIQRAALRTSHTYTLESFKQPHASQSRSVASQSRSVASRTPDSKSHLVENIENKRVVPAATKPPADELSETWLTGLQSDLAYQQLSVAVELARAKRWCEANNRRCTRRFFVNWLNRCRPASPGAARGNGRPDQALLARVSDLRAQLAREYDRTKGEAMLAELKALEGQLTGGVQP